MDSPVKLGITAYTDTGFTSKVSVSYNPFSVWINPSSYSYSRQIKYNNPQGQGGSGTSPEFNRVDDESITFNLIFDATGVIAPLPGQSYSNGVSDAINQFINLTATMNGAIHSPNYLILSWAQLQFQCVLTSLKIDYTLFRPDGTPLRAKVDVSFRSYESEMALAKQAGTSSPDLTHLITVVAQDTLPNLCYKVYGDSRFYMQVAKYNRLPSFRTLKPGAVLMFPPLSGASS